MNNYCWFCGTKLGKNVKRCNNCDAEVIEERVNIEERTLLYNELKKKENTLFVVTILLPVLAYVLLVFDLAVCTPLVLVGDLICLVYLRKKYFYSTKVKVLSSLVLIGVVIFIGFAIWICIECGIIHPGL